MNSKLNAKHFLLIVLGLLTVTSVQARSSFLLQLKRQYRLEKTVTTVKTNCQYCHQNSYGGSSWNAFGQRVRTEYQGVAKRDLGQALYLVLAANTDSDKDGYADPLEVVAGTLPGDLTSKPVQSKAALENEFNRRGGLKVFYPKIR
jgi:hypothetical protein